MENLSNQSSNVSTEFVPDAITVLIVNIIFQFDAFIRFYSCFVHLFYFWLIYMIPELRKLSLAYVHHCNFISFLFNLHYIVYYNYVHPSFQDPAITDIVCILSEVVWAMLKLLRTYSILLIAIYRVIAVFYIKLYKKLNSSLKFILMPLAIEYLICAVIFLATKYGYKTTYGYLYCFDGYSPIAFNQIAYFVVNGLIGIIIPIVAAIVLYEIIYFKLKRLANKCHSSGADKTSTTIPMNNLVATSKSEQSNYTTNTQKNAASKSSSRACNTSRSSDDVSQTKNYNKQERLAKQFLIMDICEIMSSIMVIGLGMRYLVPNFNEYYSIGRFLLRSFNLLFQSFVPVSAMFYNTDICKQINIWKYKYLNCCFKKEITV